MNTISADKLVAGYDQAQRVIAKLGDYSLVLRKTSNPASKRSRSVWLTLERSYAERALLAVVCVATAAAIALAAASSWAFVSQPGVVQKGVATLVNQ